MDESHDHTPTEIYTVGPSKQNTLWGLLIIFLLIGLFFYSQDRNVSFKGMIADVKKSIPTVSPAPPEAPTTTFIPYSAPVIEYESKDPLERMVFLRQPKSTYDIEAWFTSPDGPATKYDLPEASVAFKYPKSGKIFYQTDKRDGFYIRDINTSKTDFIKPFEYPGDEVKELFNISNIRNIAPDEKNIVFSVEFITDCGTPPDAQYGDGGPCTPDDNLMEMGYYVYNLSTKKHDFLGQTVTLTRWDIPNNILHFTDNSNISSADVGAFAYNLVTNERVKVADAPFGSWYYPLLSTGKSIQFSGNMGIQGHGSRSEVAIYDKKNDLESILDYGKWADIQPIIAIAPDESSFLYERTVKIPNEPNRRVLYLVDLTHAIPKPRQITPETPDISYFASKGMWLDESHFIIRATIMEQPYQLGYFVNINTKTGELTEMTAGLGFTDRDIYSFAE